MGYVSYVKLYETDAFHDKMFAKYSVFLFRSLEQWLHENAWQFISL